MIQSHLGHLTPPRVTPVNVYEDARKAPLWEQAFYTVWLFGIFMPIDLLQPIRYACMAGLIGLLIVHWRTTGPLMLRCWPLFLLPILAYFSIFWTPFPQDAPRSATLLFLTPVFLIVLASRLRASEFLRLTMIAGWIGTLYTAPFYATLADGGPYEQKNILAFHMMIVILLSTGTCLNQDEHPVFRLVAAAFVPVAFLFQYLAGSATSLVFAVLGTFILVLIKLVWGGVSRVQHLRSVMLALIAAVALVISVVILAIPNNTIVDDFLGLVGKNSSLTGRTAIWEAAWRVSSEHPWFGVGIEGFWNMATGTAQTLNENDFKEFGTKLSFHSAFWEVRVHFGYVGLALFLFAIAWTGVRTIGLWLRKGNLVNSTLLVMYVVIVISSFTESYASGTSSMMVYFLYFGGLAAFGIGERKFLGIGRMVERPA